MLSQDKLHELITAAVQRITIPGAVVTHDEKVGGRQFDVMVRVQLGMHTVLMAYEVKDKKRPTPVETVDAFVTKAKSVGANKSVIVSSSGFQSGALEVAKQNAVDLFNLSLVAVALPEMKPEGTYVVRGTSESLKAFKPKVRVVQRKQHTNAVREATIVYADGSSIKIPGEASQMQHCLGTSHVHKISLTEHINLKLKDLIPKGKEEKRSLDLMGVMDTFDEMFVKPGRIKGLELLVEGVEVDVIDSNYRVELSSVDRNVVYENVFTKEKFEAKLSALPLGFEDFEAGRYFFTMNPLRYHFCEAVEGDTARLVLLESFQMGELIQWEFKQDCKYSKFYLRVTDKVVLDRLGRRLEKFQIAREAADSSSAP